MPFLAAVLWALTTLCATAAAAVCAGDCDGDGNVNVNELILGVNIALGGATVDRCPSINANNDTEVTIDEIIGAVNVALTGCSGPPRRLIALSRDGRIASIELTAPWTVHATGDLGAPIASARCRDGRCLVVHPSPIDSISVVTAADLAVTDTIVLEHGADPRDVALVDDHTAVVSQYGRAALLELDLATRTTRPIDMSALADDDGLPEALRLASCGRRVFVQLRRVDHATDAPAAIGAALAVVDLDRTGSDRPAAGVSSMVRSPFRGASGQDWSLGAAKSDTLLVDADPATPGVQGIALAGRPNFDMPIDCNAGILYVAEPLPVLKGGGGYEQVDLGALRARDLPIDTGAEVGGFEVVEPDRYWLITHTDFGPGASSHLTLTGLADTYNTFAGEHVNDLALDRDADLLFFPDPCTRTPSNASCETGVHVFHAHTGASAAAAAIDVGFAPIEVTVSR